MSDNFRVGVAAVLGAGSPIASWYVSAGPALQTILTLGQIGVAVVTILYIYRKWRNARNKK